MAPADSAPLDPVSAFFRREERALVAAASGGRVLDLACGRGRHALAAAALGLDVLAVDRNAAQLAELAERAERLRRAPPRGDRPNRFGRVEVACVDLETGADPSLPGAPFAAVLVFRYLHRPLAPSIEGWLAPGGLLLYETFTTEQRGLGWGPTRDAFLLRPGELPTLFPGLIVEACEEGPTGEESPAFTARLRARKPTALR
ncbi:MAG: methyltransferase domain-containing protein [Deltaproteobacteria bacterium]|nr:methyltransferase domain-containing protein [Deltaproteobacteria bacterium]